MTVTHLTGQLYNLAAALRSVEPRLDQLHRIRADLEAQASAPDLWRDRARGRTVTSRLAFVTGELRVAESLRERLDDAALLLRMAEEEGDADVIAEVEAEFVVLAQAVEELQIRALLVGDHDAYPAVVVIDAGSDDAAATRFAESLVGMYLRWAERHDYRTETCANFYGPEGGIRSAAFTVEEPYAYGMFSADAGIHRLVQISPSDQHARQQTSIATVEVTPLAQDDDDLTIPNQDIRIDQFCSRERSCLVPANYSAVRFTHLPTGNQVFCNGVEQQWLQQQRALRVLRSRLLVAGLGAPDEVRSYVIHPDYQLVQDPRTGHENDSVFGVFSGDVDAFIAAGIHWREGRTRCGAPSTLAPQDC